VEHSADRHGSLVGLVGVYRFWRDSGYVFGGLLAGGVADALGYGGAIALVAALTAASALWVLHDMPTEPRADRSTAGIAGVTPGHTL
jgi:hypothetical protein